MMIRYLFTYGTLCRGFNNPFSKTLASNARFVEKGWFPGRLFEIDHFPGAVKSGDTGYRIHGEIYRLEDSGKTLSMLDSYEECGPGFTAPTEYIRERIDVTTAANSVLRCWAYLYNWSIDGREEITSGDYYRYYCSRYGTK